jgi:hypothetical protein
MLIEGMKYHVKRRNKQKKIGNIVQIRYRYRYMYNVPGKHLVLEVQVHQSVLAGYYVLFGAQLHVPKGDGICICVRTDTVKLC